MWWMLGALALGHGPVNDKIAALDEQIAARPDDPELYRQRGRLHLTDEHWRAAASDFATVRRLLPADAGAAYFLAEAWLAAGRPGDALGSVTAFLTETRGQPGAQVRGHTLAARIHLARNDAEAAARSFAAGLAVAERPSVDDVLQHLEVLEQLERPEAALAVMDQAIAKLGPLPTLQRKRADQLGAMGRVDEAAALYDNLIAKAGAAAAFRWHDKATMLRRAGRREAAREAEARALAAIAELPLHRQTTRAVTELAAQLRSAR